MSYVVNALRRTELLTERSGQSTAALIKALQQEGRSMSRYQYLAVISELALEASQNARMSYDEIFSQLASLPRDVLIKEAPRLVEKILAS